MIVSLWMALVAVQPNPASGPTVEELLGRNAAARGGLAPLAAMHTLRLSGHMVRGGAFEVPWTKTMARPGAVREELTLQGLTQVSVWTGAEGWSINPFGGRKDPERMSADDAKGLIEDAPIEGVLLGAQVAGLPIRYAGREDVEGTLAYKLEISRPDGDMQIVYLDPDAWLEIRVVTRRTQHGALVEGQIDYGDYEPVGGVYFPLLIELGAKGAPSSDRSKILIDQVEPNLSLPDGYFDFPGGAR